MMHRAKFYWRAVNRSGNSGGPGRLLRSLSVGTVIVGTFGLNETRDDYFLKIGFQNMDPENAEADIVRKETQGEAKRTPHSSCLSAIFQGSSRAASSQH